MLLAFALAVKCELQITLGEGFAHGGFSGGGGEFT